MILVSEDLSSNLIANEHCCHFNITFRDILSSSRSEIRKFEMIWEKCDSMDYKILLRFKKEDIYWNYSFRNITQQQSYFSIISNDFHCVWYPSNKLIYVFTTKRVVKLKLLARAFRVKNSINSYLSRRHSGTVLTTNDVNLFAFIKRGEVVSLFKVCDTRATLSTRWNDLCSHVSLIVRVLFPPYESRLNNGYLQ